MLPDACLQLADQIGVAPGCQILLDSLLQTREVQLVQAGDLGLGKALGGELSEW